MRDLAQSSAPQRVRARRGPNLQLSPLQSRLRMHQLQVCRSRAERWQHRARIEERELSTSQEHGCARASWQGPTSRPGGTRAAVVRLAGESVKGPGWLEQRVL